MPRRVVKYSDPIVFRDTVLPALIEAEAENCRIISLAMALARNGIPEATRRPHMWTVESDQRIELVALRKPGDLLEISRGSAEAAHALIEELSRDGSVHAIAGVCPTIEVIASRYADQSGLKRTLHRRYRAHCLIKLLDPPRVRGSMRHGIESDHQILSEFIDAYMKSIKEPAFPDPGKIAGELLAAERIFFWCDPQPVAMAAWAGPTPNGIRINFVYTSARCRNRGYASNVVAALTQRLLDEGRRFCFLFTDHNNLAAERMYARIGYHPVSDGEHWTFDEPR